MNFWEDNTQLDQEFLSKVLDFARSIHSHQKRKNGEMYIVHPIAVANILYEIGVGSDLIAVGLLHDTLEDAIDKEKARDYIQKNFGKKIYNLVKALTKDNSLLQSGKDIQKKYFLQIIEESKKDIGVIFVKIADLLHNLLTIEYLAPKKKEIWISELINGYLPILEKLYNTMPPSYKKNYERLINKMSDQLSLFLKI